MMDYDELADLLSEPPYGHNHGRERAQSAGWRILETDPQDKPSVKLYVEPRKHGIAYTYVKIGCRCPECRAWRSRKGNPIK